MVLLEIIVAVAMFTASAMVLGGALHASMGAAERIERDAMAADLIVTSFSELQLGLLEFSETDAETLAEEGELAEWTRQVRIEGLENVDTLSLVTVELQHVPSGRSYAMHRWMPAESLVLVADESGSDPDEDDAAYDPYEYDTGGDDYGGGFDPAGGQP